MHSERHWRTVFTVLAYCFVLGIGLFQAIASRYAMQSDGISYLDMGDAIVRGDWAMAINGYWAPLYPLIAGLALRVIHPSAYWQFTVVHLVNFAIYAFAFICFDLFLRRLFEERVDETPRAGLPRWILFALAYLAFARLALSMIKMDEVSPDMLMAAFLFLACAVVLRLRSDAENMPEYVLLGVILGLGYLAKAPMFALSFVILASALLAGGDWRLRWRGILTGTVIFVVIAGSYIGIVSKVKGRLLISDSGRINYITWVNHVSPGWYFQNIGTAKGRLIHTARRVHEDPPIYEYATPIKGTEPIWYDPSYWSAGATPRVDLRAWLTVIKEQLRAYFDLIWHGQRTLLFGFLLLGSFGINRSLWGTLWRRLHAYLPIVTLVIAGLVMYGLILVLARYVAVFFIFLCAVWLRAMEPAIQPRIRRLQVAFAALLVAVLAGTLALSTVRQLRGTSSSHKQWEVARDLQIAGVEQGSKVGRIGGVYSVDWARLGGMSVVAEVPGNFGSAFWSLSKDRQSEVIRTFQQLGVKAVVAVPPANGSAVGSEWRSLANGTFYALVLDQHS